jgi:molecular chaperone DnaK (HSP70)
VNKRIDRSISSLSEKDIKTMNADERAMRQADEIDAERAIFKNELESKVYLVEDKLSNLKLNGRISSYHGEVVKSSIEETLQWLKDHPRAPARVPYLLEKSFCYISKGI